MSLHFAAAAVFKMALYFTGDKPLERRTELTRSKKALLKIDAGAEMLGRLTFCFGAAGFCETDFRGAGAEVTTSDFTSGESDTTGVGVTTAIGELSTRLMLSVSKVTIPPRVLVSKG